MTFNPLTSIWTRPRATVRMLVAEDPTRYVLMWAVLAGIEQSLSKAAANRNPAPSLPVAITAVLIVGGLGGIFVWWLMSALVRWTGGWMGGKASGKALRTALAWASVPSVTALLLWVPRLLVFGPDILLGGQLALRSHPELTLFSLALTSVDLILALWGTVLLCNMVAEVQEFRSAWQGLANLILAGLVILVVAIPVVVLVVVLSGPHGRP